MKKNMLLSLIALSLLGCASTTPPTKLEQALFTTTTNYIPKIVVVTNLVTIDIPLYRTNEVGVTQITTNHVTYEERQTNYTTQEQYTLTPKSSIKTGAQVGGALVNVVAPGWGTIISTGALALLGIWGHIRSAQRGKVAATVIQEVETVREFIKTLPDGANYDQAIVTFLKDHQVEAGVATSVMKILANKTNSDEARGAVDAITQEIKTATS